MSTISFYGKHLTAINFLRKTLPYSAKTMYRANLHYRIAKDASDPSKRPKNNNIRNSHQNSNKNLSYSDRVSYNR